MRDCFAATGSDSNAICVVSDTDSFCLQSVRRRSSGIGADASSTSPRGIHVPERIKADATELHWLSAFTGIAVGNRLGLLAYDINVTFV